LRRYTSYIVSYLYLLSILILGQQVDAQIPSELNFQNMDKLGNLSNNYVNDIAQDSLGL